jgi:hypothetical protein
LVNIDGRGSGDFEEVKSLKTIENCMKRNK